MRGAAVQELQPGDALDQFRIQAVLARGGMATLFAATDTLSGAPVVLKVPHPQYECDVVFYQRFEREERIGQELDHPAIVKVLRPREKSRLYLAMERVEGVPLHHLLAAERPLAPERAVAIAVQLCGALACLQERGIVHRDVKPENVMVAPDGRVKLLDFGIALEEAGRRLTWAGLSHALGTPDYMAPEQIRGRRGDARTDVYALGTVLYELLTGHLPFEPGSVTALLHAKQHEAPPPPSTHRPDLDPALERVVLRAVARDPRDRYPGATALLRALTAPPPQLVVLPGGEAPHPPPAPSSRPPSSRRPTHPWRARAPLVTALGVALLGLVMWLLTSPSPPLAARLAPAERAAVVRRTLETVRQVCARAERPREFCQDQARFVLQFPECDGPCQALARDVLLADAAVK